MSKLKILISIMAAVAVMWSCSSDEQDFSSWDENGVPTWLRREFLIKEVIYDAYSDPIMGMPKGTVIDYKGKKYVGLHCVFYRRFMHWHFSPTEEDILYIPKFGVRNYVYTVDGREVTKQDLVQKILEQPKKTIWTYIPTQWDEDVTIPEKVYELRAQLQAEFTTEPDKTFTQVYLCKSSNWLRDPYDFLAIKIIQCDMKTENVLLNETRLVYYEDGEYKPCTAEEMENMLRENMLNSNFSLDFIYGFDPLQPDVILI